MDGLEGAGGHGEVGASGGAEDEQLVECVDEEAVRHVGLRASEVGGEETLAAEGVELEDAHVGVAVEGGVEGAERGGVADIEDQSGGVGVLVRIVGRRGTPVVGGGAGVGGEHEHRVDDKIAAVVVVAHLHSGPIAILGAFHAPAALAFLLVAGTVGLVDVGFRLDDIAHRGADYHVAAAFLHHDAVGTIIVERNLRRVGVGMDDEVVFQGVGGSVNLHVDTGPDVAVAHHRVALHSGAPAGWVIPEVIV